MYLCHEVNRKNKNNLTLTGLFLRHMNTRDSQILRLALPSIVSNITVPLLGLVDVAIVGHIGNARYIGAIAIGSMLFNVIYWIFGFLRMGTGGMTSQAYGRRDLGEVLRTLIRTLTIGFAIGTLFVLLQWPILHVGMLAMKPEANMLSLAYDYCRIVIWGAPAMLSLYGLTGWYVGMQNTRIPMVVSIIQNVVNIIASVCFVFVLHLDIQGVALGTVIAQWSGVLLGLLFLWRIYGRRLKLYLHQDTEDGGVAIFSKVALSRFFSVNRDIFVRTLFLVAVFLFFTAAGSRQGAMILAVNTLLMEFFTIFSYFSDGFAYAGEALAGKYYGARNEKAFHEVVRRLLRIGFMITIFFTLLYAIGGRQFLSLLTSDTAVVESSMEFFGWAVAIPLAGITAFMLDGVFVGITDTKALLSSSVLASVIFFIVYFSCRSWLGNHALWLAFVLYLATRGIVEAVVYRRY